MRLANTRCFRPDKENLMAHLQQNGQVRYPLNITL